jgi:hypothetical protein
LVSKYNKKQEVKKIEASSIAEVMAHELNRRLEEEQKSFTLVHTEV